MKVNHILAQNHHSLRSQKLSQLIVLFYYCLLTGILRSCILILMYQLLKFLCSIFYFLEFEIMDILNLCIHITLLFYQIEPQKKGHSLILPSGIARNSQELKTKIIFQIQRGILEGRTNRARPSQPSLKNCQNGTF